MGEHSDKGKDLGIIGTKYENAVDFFRAATERLAEEWGGKLSFTDSFPTDLTQDPKFSAINPNIEGMRSIQPLARIDKDNITILLRRHYNKPEQDRRYSVEAYIGGKQYFAGMSDTPDHNLKGFLAQTDRYAKYRQDKNTAL